MMVDVCVRVLTPDEMNQAVELVVRAMSDNPLHAKALGDDPETRVHGVRILQRALVESVGIRGTVLVAERDGSLAGVLGVAKRKSDFAESFNLMRTLFPALSPRAMVRVSRWFWNWFRRQPAEPYWHLGPVAVDVSLQSRGIGTTLMNAFCSLADEVGTLTYLETDKPENVAFYQRFSFQTVDVADVIGVRNWFMIRPAH
jgi:GNAT superfamily N-acetyltransferase